MIVLNVKDVSISFGVRKVLDKVSIVLESGGKLGIVGVNGAGKTTLLKVISGVYKPDEGNVFVSGSCEIGYLKQENEDIENMTVYDAVLESYKHLVEMEQEMRNLEHAISTEKDQNKYEKLTKRYSTVSDMFNMSGGFEYSSRIKGILKGLGFEEDEFSFLVSRLSGGQRTRLMMARLLSQEPDVLILDEPTNHLDIKAMEWLEGYINDYKKTVVMVSHDRYFLDKVCNEILEIEHGMGKYFKGNYSNYLERKNLDRQEQQIKYENQRKEISRQEAHIEQQRRWNRERNIIAAESRLKVLEKMERIDMPDNLPEKIKLRIKMGATTGTDVVKAEGISVSFGDKRVLNDISIDIKKNERVFVLGSNGCGKSTLLKSLTSRIIPDSGSVKFGSNVKIAYYDQELSELDAENTIYDEVLKMEEKLSETEIRNALASFLFKGDDVYKKISVLSGGEKSRVLLTKLVLSRPNLIIMDEPTNHLDINSKEVLEDALINFEGTIICVSHDRYFIKKLATRIIDFVDNGIFDFKNDYESYNEYLKVQSSQSLEFKSKDSKPAKNAYFEAKEQAARERKMKKMIAEIEEKIEMYENRLTQIENEMQMPDIVVDHIKLENLFNEKTETMKKLEKMYENWEEVN